MDLNCRTQTAECGKGAGKVCTCEQASRVEVIPFQSNAAGAHILVKRQSLGCA